VASLQDVLSIHHEQYSSDTYIPSKIAQALSVVDSEYSVVCADDDFIVPRAVERCTQFLESNPDYEVAHGHTMWVCTVELTTRKRFLTFSRIEPDTPRSKLWSRESSQRTIDYSDPGLRLHQHLLDYWPTFYSVHRRLNLMRNMLLTANLTKDYWFGELLPGCLSIIQGKLKCLDILYQVRPYNIRDSATESINRITPTYYATLLTADDFSGRYIQFRDCLADELASVSSKPKEEAKGIVNHAFLSFLTHGILQPMYGGQSSKRDTTWERTMKRAQKAMRILRIAANLALLDHGFGTMIKTPRQFVKAAYLEQAMSARQPRGYVSIDSLLKKRSPFRNDFLPVYESLFSSSKRGNEND